jgi:hypothetical protein
MFKFLGGSGGSSKKPASPTPNAKNNAQMATSFGVDPELFEDPKFDENDEDVDLPAGMLICLHFYFLFESWAHFFISLVSRKRIEIIVFSRIASNEH